VQNLGIGSGGGGGANGDMDKNSLSKVPYLESQTPICHIHYATFIGYDDYD